MINCKWIIIETKCDDDKNYIGPFVMVEINAYADAHKLNESWEIVKLENPYSHDPPIRKEYV